MGPNASTLITLALQASIQAQTYQAAVLKAAAEGRDVTDEEVAAAKADAMQAIATLEAAA